jgi:hypothetical protein
VKCSSASERAKYKKQRVLVFFPLPFVQALSDTRQRQKANEFQSLCRCFAESKGIRMTNKRHKSSVMGGWRYVKRLPTRKKETLCQQGWRSYHKSLGLEILLKSVERNASSRTERSFLECKALAS